MRALGSIQAKHVYQEANGMTYHLAHIASCSNLDVFLTDDTPSIIEDVLSMDLCHVARGLSFMSPSQHNVTLHQ